MEISRQLGSKYFKKDLKPRAGNSPRHHRRFLSFSRIDDFEVITS